MQLNVTSTTQPWVTSISIDVISINFDVNALFKVCMFTSTGFQCDQQVLSMSGNDFAQWISPDLPYVTNWVLGQLGMTQVAEGYGS